MKKTEKTVVLLSGGLDSATLLAMQVKQRGTENVKALNITYGQKHDREIESAKKVADYYGVSYQEIDMSDALSFSECSLLKRSSKEIKHESYAEQLKETNGNPVDTYVPFRNGLFISAAVAYAISIGADRVCCGVHADDAVGNAYPDCSCDFIKAMTAAISYGTNEKIKLDAPFVSVSKAQIVEVGAEIGVPYELTWSCYEGGDKPCGKCGTCIDRARAFEKNGMKDPTLGGTENV